MSADFWRSEIGEQLLVAAIDVLGMATELTASEITRLRHQFPDVEAMRISEAAGFASRMVKAGKAGKLPASKWLFTRDTYEQSTAPKIAAYHAARFAGCASVVEICTGAGSDTLALSAVAEKVVTLEADDYTAALATTNFGANAAENIEVVTTKAEDFISVSEALFDGMWADPARRNASKRVYSPNDYQPSLRWLLNLNIAPRCGIKISPAITLENLPDGWVREWIGFNGECREQVLWRGVDVKNGTVALVDSGNTWAPQNQRPAAIPIVADITVGGFILEPHAALIRSGFLSSWFAERSVELLDSTIAYGYAARKPDDTCFAVIFEVISVITFSYKRLQNEIEVFAFTSGTEIKKRGFPEEPELIRSKLRFSDTGIPGVIILTRHRGSRIAILCRRVQLIDG